MSKASRRPTREKRKVVPAKERRRAQRDLSDKREKEGYTKLSHPTNSNHKCTYKTVEEERLARNEATTEQVRVLRAIVPQLIRRFSKMEDTRNPKKTKYKMTVLMLYGILSFVLQMSSSREATREMSRAMFWENLQLLFPEFGDNAEAPHHETLKRLLSGMDVNEISDFHVELIKKWIKGKKFKNYLVNNHYLVSVDGTQKMCRDRLWDAECLQRTFNKGEDNENTQYYVYVLQATLTLSGGMSIPLMTEFLSYSEGDADRDKQDCETKSFHRLAKRLKEAFPHLRIMVLLDGLYPNGPVFEACLKNNWQFMIVLPDKVLKDVMTEFEAIAELEPKDRHSRIWGDRKQHFKWANGIDYYFGPNNKKKVTIHVVECRETWEEIEQEGTNTVKKDSRHVWISSDPLDQWNVHERCNLSARARWTIETGFLIEKHHGYNFEHCFSYNWNAMKGYHYLMQLGHMFNVMARRSKIIDVMIKDLGMRGFIRFVCRSIASPWLDSDFVKERLGLANLSYG
jgi:hypothetical protein